jgi:hypothetical protein
MYHFKLKNMQLRYINKLFMPLLAVTLSVTSCSEDVLDDINKNVNDPLDAPSQFAITDAIVASAFNVVGSDLAFYASTYTEHNVGIYGQMYNAEKRIAEPISATTYNNGWNNAYTNLRVLKEIIKKTSEGGKEVGNFKTLGVAQVLTALNLAILTDLYGDIPWTEAAQPGVIFQPKMDKQQAIYADILQLLTDAITNLGKTSTFASLGSQDLIYGGDYTKWTKFAYGLRARYKLRLSFRNPQYQSVIDDINNSFTSKDDEAALYYDGSSASNPFAVFANDRDYFGASTSLHNKLVARSDPRDQMFFEKYPGTPALEFAPNGDPEEEQERYGISALTSDTNPTYLLSYHEVQFIKAEAYARLNNIPLATTALQEGVRAAFIKVGLTAAQANTYFATSVQPLFLANPLKEISVQKYISFFEDEAIEAYSDYRRLKAMGNNFIELENPENFPLRYTYASSDVTTNNNVREAYGTGQYVYTENVWWAGGTR